MANKLILRIQTPDGTKRFNVNSGDSTDTFLRQLKEQFGLEETGWSLYTDRKKEGEIKASKRKTLKGCGIKHGDMLYVLPKDGYASLRGDAGGEPDSRPASAAPSQTSVQQTVSGNTVVSQTFGVLEDAVDQELVKEDGMVLRKRNPQLCQHLSNGRCVHCSPLEPWDETYLRSLDPPVKFLSFHSYIRKQTSGVNRGKFVALENLSCKIKPGCTEHLPWPKGICTKCQPSAVTLNRQPYRHVDFIQFENPEIVERYLDYWRRTGAQRIGFLYGRYEVHKDVPLGIRAVVSAIYEPPQMTTRNDVELLDDSREEEVEAVARELGMTRIGWVFTDLTPLDTKEGTVKHYRGNVDTHFLSAEECIVAAGFQNKYPNLSRLASSLDGQFGSKFVTVVVTGDKDNRIHFEGYQVSNQCMALVRDNCLVPTKDASELGYVRESSNEQYVPDVFYTEKDKYGNEVKRLARPLPVEYLLVDMPAAFPVQPSYTCCVASERKPFVVEHREQAGQTQDFDSFNSYMRQFGVDDFLEALSEFHLLIYFATSDMLPLKTQMKMLLSAVKSQDKEAATQFIHTEEWQTVEHLMDASLPTPPPGGPERKPSFVGPHASPLPPIGNWACQHCTFANSSDAAECEMCGLPKA